MLFALVLASAFLHAAWNALLKGARDPRVTVHPVVGLSGILAAAVALGELALGGSVPGLRALAWSAGAGLFEARYFHALGAALASGPLGPVYTISRGGAAFLIWPISVAFLGEELSLLAAAGSALILLGLAGTSFERGMTAVALRGALECAGLIAGYHFAYKLALQGGTSPAAVFATSMAVAAAVNLAAGGRAHAQALVEAVRAAPGRVALAGTVCGASFLAFMIALARGGAAYVFTLRNTSVLFATLLALVLGERPTRRALFGSVLVCAGAALLGLA